MTRDEQHRYRIMNEAVEDLGRTDFIERRAMIAKRAHGRRQEELKRLAPVDMTRRHRINALHPKARKAA